MNAVTTPLIGRFGNQLFQFAKAKAYAEQREVELKTEAWIGEKIFTLDGHPCVRPSGSEERVPGGYCQSQDDLIYTRADCRRWFKLKPEVEAKLESRWWKKGDFITDMPHAHFRRGDFAGAGYPLISERAVAEEIQRLIGDIWYIGVSDEKPTVDPDFSGDLAMLPDFYRLMRAPILFRANSSYSYWAGLLGNGRVFSPIITGLAGGVEHDEVPYVEGNHARLSEHDFVTELHLRES